MTCLQTIIHQSEQPNLESVQCWEHGFKIRYSRRKTLNYWESYYGGINPEQFDSLALSSYVQALEDGWDSKTPLPDHYELYDDPNKQSLYFEHLSTQGIVFLESIQVEQMNHLIDVVYQYVQEIDPFGANERKPHHQRRLRFDLNERKLYRSVPFEKEGAWELMNREDYLVMNFYESKMERVYHEFKALSSLMYFPQRFKEVFQGISHLIRTFYLKKYPLPEEKQSLFNFSLHETLTGCLKQMHLIHYQAKDITAECLDEWVVQTPTELLIQFDLKPNQVFQNLIINSLDHLSSIYYLKKEGFSTHEISLLLQKTTEGSQWFKHTMEKPWVQAMLKAQGHKQFCRHWFHSGREMKELLTDIDRAYHQLKDTLNATLFEPITSRWDYHLSFECFEQQLLDDLSEYDLSVREEPFAFQTPWIREVFESGRCLFSHQHFQLMIPKNERELKREGKRYRMCFSTYLGSIRQENTFIFFIRDSNDELKGAIRLKRQIMGWEVVEVKRTYNRPPTEAMLRWIDLVVQQRGWEWNCPDTSPSLACA